jgi:hypothetical protein
MLRVCSTANTGTLLARMSPIKAIWASVQGDPVFMRRANGWLTIFWIVMIPISLVTGWVRSVTYVSALSLWVLVSGRLGAWQASRVEVEQQRETANRDRQDVAGEVVHRLVEETEIAPDKAGSAAR